MRYLLLLLIICIAGINFPQNSPSLIYVDDSGRIKWAASNKEAYFYGVNYSTPFAFSYRALKNKAISHKDAIDLDVQQFKRLGINAYRIHVWDREVSDREGNLLVNEHIELLDYLISKLIENDIYIILTPIAWWGTGWPEPDMQTPGFSSFYSKIESTTKPDVIEAQKNYLKQFVNHKNSYTGKSNKDEKLIIGFEIFNEPNLPRNEDSITTYVNSLVEVLKKEGVTKPIFFNISENNEQEHWKGVASSKVDGISFQWYPTGLVKYSELEGNFTPNVMNYQIPNFTDKIKSKSKMIYEFDAADVGKSYMYPLMAHSFKEAGMQWATMFCYDPTVIAQYNAEYPTHYLNLLYTPQKAISFLISSTIFVEESLLNKTLDSTSVIMGDAFSDYSHDLSLLNESKKFYYSGNTNAAPADVNNLENIAGYGSSSIIKYEGRGAYFIDKIEQDLWKLEVFPDAVWLKDPFGKNGLDDPVSKLIWKTHKMKIMLPGLNSDYNLYSLNRNSKQAVNNEIEIEPGVYFVTNGTASPIDFTKVTPTDFEKIKKYGEFINGFTETEIRNLTPLSFYEDDHKKIEVEVYSNENNLKVFVYVKRLWWRGFQKIQLQKLNDFTFEAQLPNELSAAGIIEYYIALENDERVLTFPGKLKMSPDFWSFNPKEKYELSIYPSSDKKIIYQPARDFKNLTVPNIWRFVDYQIDYSFDFDNKEELNLKLRSVRNKFPEFALQFYVGKYTQNIQPDYNQLELEIESSNGELDSAYVRVLYDDTKGFEQKIAISPFYEKIKIPLIETHKFNYALLPRPYPTFLPYWYVSNFIADSARKPKLESIQIAIPLPEPKIELKEFGIKIKSISLTKAAHD
ncbi:MAG: hypothetical protein HXY50_05475 [Ignavibacteriaceae bacterium]|nr:hypothetical protein [Ignavibacteriaceae bacterium]